MSRPRQSCVERRKVCVACVRAPPALTATIQKRKTIRKKKAIAPQLYAWKRYLSLQHAFITASAASLQLRGSEGLVLGGVSLLLLHGGVRSGHDGHRHTERGEHDT